MSFRNDHDAALARVEALEQELARERARADRSQERTSELERRLETRTDSPATVVVQPTYDSVSKFFVSVFVALALLGGMIALRCELPRPQAPHELAR